MTLLEGKVGLITGAAQGIGRAYAIGAAEHGAAVVAADIQDCSQTKDAVEAIGGKIITVKADVSDEASTQAMANAAIDQFGRLDFLVNNASIWASIELKYWEEISVDEWDRMMAVNVRGMFLAAKAAVPLMSPQHSGSIINISSGTALAGVAGCLHYATSKAAIIGLTRSLAREVGDFGINVNAITPGFTLSEASKRVMDVSDMAVLEDMTVAAQCFKRSEQPEDLVGTVIYLASDLSKFVTGQVINVDGGWVMN